MPPALLPPPRMWRRHRSTLIVAAVCAVSAGLVVLGAVRPAGAQPQPAPVSASATPGGDAGVHLDATQWASLRIEPVAARAFDLVASVDAVVTEDETRSVPVYAPISGRVAAVAVQRGDRVRRGTPLLTMVGLEAAQAGSDLAAAAAAAASARAQLAQARANEQREHALLLAEAAAEKDWQQSRTDLATAENAAAAAEVGLKAAQAKAGVLQGEAATPGQVVLRAPLDGVVVQRQVAAGQLVNSLAAGSSAPLFTVSDLRRVWVVGAVGEDEAAGLQPGQPVQVAVAAQPGVVRRARLSWVGAEVDPATRRVPVRAELDNGDLALKPQMSGTLRVLAAASPARPAIPLSAIVYDGSAAHCYVVAGAHTLVSRALQLGRQQQGFAEVLAGLAVGDRVVTGGALFVDDAAEDNGS